MPQRIVLSRRFRSGLRREIGAFCEVGCDAQTETDPEYILIHGPRNGGYAAGNNLGILHALTFATTEYVFVLNNDTRIEPECIQRLIECADQDVRIGIVGSTVIEDRGNLRIAGGNKYNPFLTISKPARATHNRREWHIDYVAGAAQFIRADTLKRVGLLSEDYFLYFEELDLTRRIERSGFESNGAPKQSSITSVVALRAVDQERTIKSPFLRSITAI